MFTKKEKEQFEKMNIEELLKELIDSAILTGSAANYVSSKEEKEYNNKEVNYLHSLILRKLKNIDVGTLS